MARQPETRLCHVLTDDFGLRAFENGSSNILGRRAGFNATAWKIDGDVAFRRDLSIDYSGNAVARSLIQRKLTPKTTALIEIGWPLIAPVETWESERSQMLRYIGPSSDTQMRELQEMVRNPKQWHDLSVGRFVRDDRLGWIEAELIWMGQPIRASIEAQLEIDIPEQEKLLVLLLSAQPEWDAKARKAIISGLYTLWRDVWREDDPMLNEADFANRMEMESIGIQRGGGFDFWFKDADLFWGHSVLMRGTFNGGFEPGEMHG